MTPAGRVHPLLVHSPIAIARIVAAAEMLAMTTHQQTWRVVAWTNTLIGALFALIAGSAGWLFARDAGAVSATLEWHRWLAVGETLALVLAATATGSPGSTSGDSTYRVFLFVSTPGIGVAAHLGAALVWGADFLHF
jgi:uncharacterized membrane protein